MSPVELVILQTVTERVDHAIREGHKDGLPGLRESERELVVAMSTVIPDESSEKAYRAAADTLEDLRRAIEAELILEGTPDEDPKLLLMLL